MSDDPKCCRVASRYGRQAVFYMKEKFSNLLLSCNKHQKPDKTFQI